MSPLIFNRKNLSVKNETSKYTKKTFLRGGLLKLKISRAVKKVAPQPPPTKHIPRMIFFDFPIEIIFRIANNLEVNDLNCFLQTSPRLAKLLSPVLLKRAVTHNLLHYRNRTVLHWASAHHRIDLVQALLAQGASANTSDEWGMTPLHSAVLSGNDLITLVLLENGAIIDQVDTECEVTALQCAALLGNHVIAGLLLNHGANIDAYSRVSMRMTAVQFAVVLGYVRVVELLVGRGCHLDKIYEYGPTPAMLDKQSGREIMVELLGGLTRLYDTTINADAYGATLNGTNGIRGILIRNEILITNYHDHGFNILPFESWIELTK
ncbi:ankyrin repeat-containing domain protein [Morchella snyderi]|nr:ankyrin repeat-containing domain protein [Morchella snyderi]